MQYTLCLLLPDNSSSLYRLYRYSTLFACSAAVVLSIRGSPVHFTPAGHALSSGMNAHTCGPKPWHSPPLTLQRYRQAGRVPWQHQLSKLAAAAEQLQAKVVHQAAAAA